MANLARFLSVTKSFDGRTAVVRNLDLDVVEGEFLTLLGPSGSGKTTTLMMLAGFETATSGEILLRDRPVTHVPPHKRNIGMVFQNYALFPHMTVAENVAFPLKVRGVGQAEIAERVARALAMISLESFGARRPEQLSGGQQQRVAVARALVFGPAIVLMDEPLGALDKQLREQMQYEIKQLHDRLGITILYVTHDQGEALSISDRIAVFRNGAIEQLATPAELYEAPASSFVAQFIGENNSPSGRIVGRSGDTCRVALDDGPEVEARATRLAPDQARTTLSVRTERMLLDDDARDLPTQLWGTVTEIIYLGDHLRVRIAVGSQSFVAKIPNTRRIPIRRGQAVTIGWHTSDCFALDEIGALQRREATQASAKGE